jgi:membrane AbrB-like protein
VPRAGEAAAPKPPPPPVRPLPILAACAATAAGGWLAGRAGLPSGYLFAAILVGLAVALGLPNTLALPPGFFGVGQAVAGVVVGTYLQTETLGQLGTRWIPVALVSVATLALTIGAGLLLARLAPLDRATASLGMVAGGASGIVAMADELGADDRLVAFMQYLRVAVIVFVTPLLVSVAFPGHAHPGGAGAATHEPVLGTPGGWAMTIAISAAGALAGPRLRLPAATLLGPMLLAAALTLAGPIDGVAVPPLVREAAFAAIGLQIGLRFERDTVRSIARLLIPVMISILALGAGSFLLAYLLTLTAGVSLLNAYLATTPGGLYAVLPIAFGSGGDAAFVLAVQGLRVFVMVLAAPAIVRLLVRGQPPATSRRRNTR